MSWPRSVRARLALWHGLALLVVVSVYAAAVLFQVRDDLYEALDAQLDGDQALAVQWLRAGPLGSRRLAGRRRAGGDGRVHRRWQRTRVGRCLDVGRPPRRRPWAPAGPAGACRTAIGLAA